MRRTLSFSIALACLTACGGGGRSTLPTGPSPVSAKVEFAVVSFSRGASTTPECAGEIRIQPSFWGFAHVNVVPAEPGAWGVLFEDVPIGRHTVRLRAPVGCGEVELGANGVRLTDRESEGSQIAFHFLLHADGSVSP